MREGLDNLHAALDHYIAPAAVIAGDAADDDAKGKANGDANQPDGQRDAGPVDHPRHQIATEPVSPEQEQLPALGRADEMQIARKQAPELVAVPTTEKPQGLPLVRVGSVDPL